MSRPEPDARRAELLRVIHGVRRRWRTRQAVRGVALTLVTTLAAVLVAALAVQRAGHDPLVILIARGAAFLVLLAAATRFLIVPLLRRVTDERIALYLEEREPSLEASVISALDESATSAGASPALARRTVEHAVARCHAIDDGRRIEGAAVGRLSSALATVALAAVLLGVLSPDALRHAARALITPLQAADALVVRRGIDVTPGSVEVPRGADQLVTARLRGLATQQVDLVFRTGEDTLFQRLPMLVSEDSSTFELRLIELAGATDYFVEADGFTTPTYRISVIDVPYVEAIELELVYPAYTGLEPETIERGGDIAAPRGTRVRLRAQSTVPVPGGRIALDRGRPIEMSVTDDGRLAGEFVVERRGFYNLELHTADGRWLDGSPQYTIDIIEDDAPVVRFVRPQRDERATSIQEVYVEARAIDDFGIAALTLHYAVNGGEPRTVELYRGARRDVVAGHTFHLEEYDLEPGDLIAYWAEARDTDPYRVKTAQSDIYFIQVRPFGREYRQADASPPPGGGGGDDGGIDGQLSETQRQIVAATFNLTRDRAQLDDEDFAESVNTIRLAQERLREQVTTLVRRMQSRGVVADTMFRRIAEILPLATAEMDDAIERLRQLAPEEALPPEQRAMQQLLRAEALYREVQIAFQQGGGGGGGQMPNAQDLADLFELELDRMRNQYETLNRSPAGEQQAAIDETLERLRELARRQQQEAERLRRQAAMGGQAGGGDSQRQLADETEETARRLERLARERDQPQLAETARQLRDAAENMRRAAAQARSGNTGDANAALEQLREARRRLEREGERSLRQSAQEVERRIDGMLEEQRRTAEDVRRLAGEPAGAPGRADEMRRLQERRTRQAGDVRQLEREIDRLADQARAEEPQASRALRGAANELRDAQTRERMEFSRSYMQPGSSRDYVRRMEESIEQGLDAARRRVAEANRTLGEQRAGTNDEDALDRARDLARGLASLEERMQRAREGQPGQPGQDDGGRTDGGAREGQPGDGRTDAGAQGSAFGGGRGAPIPPEQLRQFRRELSERVADAEALRRELRAAGRDTRELDAAIAGLRRLAEAPLPEPELLRLQAEVLAAVQRFEFALRRELIGETRERLNLSATADVPEAFRRLVEEYYRSLGRR